MEAAIAAYLNAIASNFPASSTYNIVLIFDYTPMARQDADNIYSTVTSFPAKKPILLILYSNGGAMESAYLIGKLIQEHTDRFVAVVPRQAKSAATLLCCAAHEIHMGSLSELGPIDPQIDDMPALGLKSSIEHLATLVTAQPGSAEMFAQYLTKALPIINLGYYERVAESAVQYAEKCLATHSASLGQTPTAIAQALVHGYKDHGFVIDATEAAAIFGPDTVKSKTVEYELGNALYNALKIIERYAGYLNHDYYLIGDLNKRPVFTRKKKPK